MSVKRTIPAGVLDSGMASLASFIVGVQAVRTLDPAALGAYALVFSGFSLLMELPSRLVLIPAEIDAARRPRAQRLDVLTRSVPFASGWLVAAGLLLTGVIAFVPGEVPSEVLTGLILTAVPCTMVSPLQDHVRKVLHIGGLSVAAAGVSAVQLMAVAVSLVVLASLGAAPAWQPFGALLFANVTSTAFGLVTWGRRRGEPMIDPPGFVALIRSGRWHLGAGSAPKAGGFLAASLVAHLAGVAALGYAEGARVLARPIGVLSQGIKATLGPPLMRSAARSDAVTSRRLSRIYAAVIGGCGLLYLSVAGFDWTLNPMVALMPSAYVVPGLAAITILFYVLDRVAGAGAGLQLHGAGQERRVAIVEIVASTGHLAGALTAPLTGAFAIPIGYAAMAAIRRPWLALHVRRIYGAAPRLTGESEEDQPSSSMEALATPRDPHDL